MDDKWGGITAEQFSKISDKVYERLLSEHTRVSAGQLEMAKWMIASLLLINGAALAACVQSSRITGDIVKAAGVAYTVGIILAILAGLGTWVHSDRVKKILRDRIESNFLVDPHLFPDRNKSVEKKVKIISNVSAMIGLASLVSFAVGCAFVGTQLPRGLPVVNDMAEKEVPNRVVSHERNAPTPLK